MVVISKSKTNWTTYTRRARAHLQAGNKQIILESGPDAPWEHVTSVTPVHYFGSSAIAFKVHAAHESGLVFEWTERCYFGDIERDATLDTEALHTLARRLGARKHLMNGAIRTLKQSILHQRSELLTKVAGLESQVKELEVFQ